MRSFFLIAGLILVSFAVTAIYMRLVAMPADAWHVEPAEVTPPTTSNFVLLRGDDAPVRQGTLADVAARIDAIAQADGAVLIGGAVADGHMTYVQRSALMGFPDAVSIRLRDAGEGAVAVELFSRSRFGQSDLGVNRERVTRWLEALQAS